jgi:RNA polymerase sigma factor (sigma-70 family)
MKRAPGKTSVPNKENGPVEFNYWAGFRCADPTYLYETVQPVLEECLGILQRWRPPPWWSRFEWHKEVRQIGAIAASEASKEFDPANEIPLDCVVFQRVRSRALASYRREWAFGLRYVPSNQLTPNNEESPAAPGDLARAHGHAAADEWRSLQIVRDSIAALPEAFRRVIEMLYFEGATQFEAAEDLSVCQATISNWEKDALKLLRELVSEK